LIKKEIKTIHEFLADEYAMLKSENWQYAELLLMQALNTKLHLVNPFFHNQIKRRIAMITSSQKPGHQYLRKLLVLPVAAVIAVLFAFSYKNRNAKDDSIIRSNETITIDVVMTREDDKLPGGATDINDALKKRVEISNNANPHAFISIHVSAGELVNTTKSGFDFYISNRKSVEKDKLLASAVANEISKIYKSEKTIKQRSNKGLWVLDKNSSPSLIIECGYINNTKDLSFITDKSNQEKIARAILNAVSQFVDSYDSIPQDYSIDPPKTLAKHINDARIDWQDTTKVLIVVNDTIYSRTKKENINKIYPPNSIESITVLKDKAAISKYGEAGRNGVIEIITKPSQTKNSAEMLHDSRGSNNSLKEITVMGFLSQNRNEPIFEKVEIEPAFPGGEKAWRQYLEKNLNALVAINNGAKEGTYKVQIKFLVDKTGAVSNIKALTKNGFGMEEEVIRVIVKGPDWVPAFQDGKAVNAYKTQPVTFVITEENRTPTSGKVVNGSGLKSDKPSDNTAPAFEKVETPPSFPGGITEWRKYLTKNLNSAVPVDSGAKAGIYTVKVKFLVHKDGSISSIEPLTKYGYGMEEEVIRVISKGPKWEPAKQNGRVVNAYHTQPVTFVITEEDDNTQPIITNEAKKESPPSNFPKISMRELQRATPEYLLRVNLQEIVSFTYTTDSKNGLLHASVNTGSQFNTATKRLIQNTEAGNVITIDEIWLMINGEKKKSPAQVYRVTD
jgi:TonB-dependent SusC/RagA subfamily outer membrane receptor